MDVGADVIAEREFRVRREARRVWILIPCDCRAATVKRHCAGDARPWLLVKAAKACAACQRVAVVPGNQGVGSLALSDRDTASHGSGVVIDPVVRNLQSMSPTVHEDSATTLRAVGDGQTIDARWVAEEVAGVAGEIAVGAAERSVAVRRPVCQQIRTLG